MTRIYVEDRGAKIPAATRSGVESVKGWLKPIYTETPAQGRPLYGLGPKDFYKVVNGYACPECLADFGDLYRAVCPACGHERDVAADVAPTPGYWQPDPNDPDRSAA